MNNLIQFKRDTKQKSDKLHLDQYYTPTKLAKYCIDKTFSIIGREKITEIIDPSAGNGSFSLQIPNCIAYDIDPKHDSIIEQDFLTLNCIYKSGRLFITNPPFGARNFLAEKFFKKAILLGDFVVYILPISQLNNTQRLYEFDLIHSEDLKSIPFSDRQVNCCFNIYCRPKNGLNKKIKICLKSIRIEEVRCNSRKIINYDLAINAWGSSIGKILSSNDKYAKVFYISILEKRYYNEILKVLHEANWQKIYLMTSTPNLLQWQVFQHLKNNIPGIE